MLQRRTNRQHRRSFLSSALIVEMRVSPVMPDESRGTSGHTLTKNGNRPLTANLSRRRHPQRFPHPPLRPQFRIPNRPAVGRDAAQPAEFEDAVGGQVANPLLQDELRRIGEFGAHGLRIAGHAVHPEQHLLETPTLSPPGLPVHGGFVRNYEITVTVHKTIARI
jgi:hypothetical protein